MQKRNKGLNKQAAALLVCIIAAFALWVYVTYVEDPDMTRWETGIPVTIVGEDKLLDAGLAISEITTEKVDVKFSAPRSRFKYLSSDSVTAAIDVSKITAPGSSLMEISVSCSSDYTIVDRRRTTTRVTVEEYVKDKFFEITPNIEKVPQNRYSLKSTHIDGKDLMVGVSGPISKVELVKSVVTDGVDLSSVVNDATMSLTLIPVDENGKEVKGVNLSMETANVTFVIYKTATLPIEVSYYNNGDSDKLECELDINTVDVTGPASDIDALTSISTHPISEHYFKAGSETTVGLTIPENVALCDESISLVTITFKKAE